MELEDDIVDAPHNPISVSGSSTEFDLNGEEAQRAFVVKEHGANEHHNFCSNRISTAKYNLATFFPKFLYEQFSRHANLFFLFIALIQQIPNVSPTGQWTTALPLSIVLIMTAVKELAEDFKRHKADNEVNRRKVKVFRDLTFRTARWTEVRVGDVVKVLNNQYFPADLVLLSSSEPEAMCYVETANLDGETNLKIRQGHPQTAHLLTRERIRTLQARVECETPNERLYKFVGNIIITRPDGSENVVPLGADQFLQRGAQLKNTPWVYGVVVFTGHESKLLKNNKAAPIKRSNVDDVYNRQIIYLFFTLVSLAVMCTIAYAVWTGEHRSDWYLGFKSKPPLSPGLTLFTFMILFNNLIPISLIITLDIVKYFQALVFINNDVEMYDEATDTPARARTSALNEELGQVQYIFSDKTGTLTCNEMVFLKCSIAGVAYGDVQQDPGVFSDPALLDNLTSGHDTASVIREWLTLLAVCHTVIPERDRTDPDVIVYQAASPDEAALVSAVKRLGFSFNVRQPDRVVINALGSDETFFILNVLEFNSTRKRMSVIVRDESGAIKLLTKGADSVIFERLSQNQPFADATKEHLHRFATEGLRTLCVGVRLLREEEYNEWARVYEEASTAIHDRAAKLDRAAELIEKDLFLLGATAIEDRLQEQVPETIQALANAGINIWVCTGDKQETAINIGFSCRLLNSTMDLLIANETTLPATMAWCERELEALEDHGDRPLALIIDGPTLEFALDQSLRLRWLQLAKACKAVVCCRVSPLQKAEVVRLVKENERAITLAIGDGANDVAMIQAAHVGVGISGKEGLQAARASDYSIGQFRFLQRLLLVHGAWSYRRVTMLILYSFYKNIALYLIELWYAFSNGFSGQILFERWTIATYNVAFTLLPPVAIGIFDQHLSAETLLAMPHLYKSGPRREHFNTRVFWGWTLNSIFHSVILFWLPLEMFRGDTITADGQVGGQWVLGHVVYSIVVYTVTLKAALVTESWTIYNHIAVWGSALIWLVFTFAYFELWAAPGVSIAHEVFGIGRYMYRSARVWFSFLVIPALALLRDVVFVLVRHLLFPTEEVRLQRLERRHQVIAKMPEQLWAEMHGRGTAQDYTGYAFSQNENTDSITQMEIIRRYDTTVEKPQGE
ncbi:hypothetical protein PTSG_00182 [Salpingoeca rosetta]|uniref:Phospholipid-transporting ATPase n=1 Tax=Salpingoeca rosetta (strain ATCC 50818 / BSB-021) TaxID=946362 RepID=F2TVR5_SALR5|nr:uncharacterized protein PTSG_00182 [Salpingoeca rosetta]EGD72161.1 hypothetical protein PTSG_00182 [Salpingoeca rosetta]|eukprot:XP_004998733.1 hypothetical protein PTSG_00182 [Salpingoeca rosetta]